MLYLTTKNKADSFTSHRMLRMEAAPDGGMFMPMRIPVQNDVALAAFEQMNFSEAAAAILNIFLDVNVTGWDVDFAVGRQVVDLFSIGHKVAVAESWHNPKGSHTYLVQRLYALVTDGNLDNCTPNVWFETVVNIAILFGVYGKFCRREVYSFDVAVQSGDLTMLLAVRYAQKMGLPIRKIILGCMDGDNIWDFLSYGDYSTGRKARLIGFEALLWLQFGYDEVKRYLDAIQTKTIYRLGALHLEQFRKDLFCAVVGDHRADNTIASTYHTDGYAMDRSTARAFSALQDYRAKTGENKNTLLFAKELPAQNF